MNIKQRLKSYSFWVSLASAIFLLLKVIGQRFGFSVDESLYNDIFTALCGILVICGIVAPPTGKEATLLPASSTAQSTTIANSTDNAANGGKTKESAEKETEKDEKATEKASQEAENKITSDNFEPIENENENTITNQEVLDNLNSIEVIEQNNDSTTITITENPKEYDEYNQTKAESNIIMDIPSPKEPNMVENIINEGEPISTEPVQLNNASPSSPMQVQNENNNNEYAQNNF